MLKRRIIKLRGELKMYQEMSYRSDEIIQYLRKSRADDPNLSVEDVLRKHESILSEWASLHNYCIPEANTYREVVSGETIDDRPEFLSVLRRIESPAIKAILCVEVQRLSRGDLEDAGRLIKILRYTRTNVITPQKTYDLSDEYDRDIFERELKRGNEYLEYQKRIMNRGRLLAVQQGDYIGSVAPYGYDKTVVLEGKKKHCTLSINESEASAVRQIFQMRAYENLGPSLIAKRLNAQGLHPRVIDSWTCNSVKGILGNPVYTGKVFWMRRGEVRSVRDGSVEVSRPWNPEYMLYDGRHPAIIDETLFRDAQKISGKVARVKDKAKVRNPFAGLFVCRCGHSMSYHTYPKTKARILCDAQAVCHTGSCTFDEAEDIVARILRNAIHDFDVQLKDASAASASREETLASLRSRLSVLERKEVSLWDKYSEEQMPKEIFDELNRRVREDLASVRSSIDTILVEVPSKESLMQKHERFSAALAALYDDTITAEKKNIMLKSCIEKIDYYRDPPVKKKGRGVGRGWIATDIVIDAKLCI